MTTEDRAHRNRKLNPRRHGKGGAYRNPTPNRLWEQMKRCDALLDAYEKQFIQDVPRLLGAGDYVNLGHDRGGSAILLASGLEEHQLPGRIYSVEIEFTRKARNTLKRYSREGPDVGARIAMCEGSTDDWAAQFRLIRRGMPFNFVFIDADHTYDAVMRDFQNWSPMVRTGGWVAMHDTNQDFSHRAIKDAVSGGWVERKEYHISTIRTFERTK